MSICWIAVDNTTKQIKAAGVCNCQKTYDLQPIPANCQLVKFIGGVNGCYFVNNQMQSEAP